MGIVEYLKEQVKNKKVIDVSAGVEDKLGITRAELDIALIELKSDGHYVVCQVFPSDISDLDMSTPTLILTTWEHLESVHPKGYEGDTMGLSFRGADEDKEDTY